LDGEESGDDMAVEFQEDVPGAAPSESSNGEGVAQLQTLDDL